MRLFGGGCFARMCQGRPWDFGSGVGQIPCALVRLAVLAQGFRFSRCDEPS